MTATAHNRLSFRRPAPKFTTVTVDPGTSEGGYDTITTLPSGDSVVVQTFLEGEPHNDRGPAVIWPDCTVEYFLHGEPVDQPAEGYYLDRVTDDGIQLWERTAKHARVARATDGTVAFYFQSPDHLTDAEVEAAARRHLQNTETRAA